MTADDHRKHDDFLRAFTAARDDILAYIYSLVPSHAEAEDIFQEVSILLWRNFDEFRPDGNFRAWARKMAWLEVQNMRRIRKELIWDPETIEALDVAFREEEAENGTLSDMKAALERCLARLSNDSRFILQHLYGRGETYAVLGRLLNRSCRGLKVTAHRIRQRLSECVERQMLAERGKS